MEGDGIPRMLLIANMQSIPAEYEEAAALDGANEWNKFRYITLSLLKPALTNTYRIDLYQWNRYV